MALKIRMPSLPSLQRFGTSTVTRLRDFARRGHEPRRPHRCDVFCALDAPRQAVRDITDGLEDFVISPDLGLMWHLRYIYAGRRRVSSRRGHGDRHAERHAGKPGHLASSALLAGRPPSGRLGRRGRSSIASAGFTNRKPCQMIWKTLTKLSGSSCVNSPEGSSDDRAPSERAGMPDRALSAPEREVTDPLAACLLNGIVEDLEAELRKDQARLARSARLTLS